MERTIFRKKSLDRINSPESLNEYIKVANPGMWILLISIIVLLCGALVWAYFGTVNTWENAIVYVSEGQAYCQVNQSAAEKVQNGMQIVVDSYEGTIGQKIDDSKEGTTFLVNINIPDGVYEAKILVESISPKMLIFN